MIKFNTSGFDELERKLKKIEQNAKSIAGNNSIPFTELLPLEFMEKYTQFDSLEDMFNKSPFTIESAEDFAIIDDEEWNEFIKTSTQFDSWNEMQETAAVEWTKAKLGF